MSHRELILNMPESKSSLSTLNGLTCLHIFSSSTFVTLADMPCSVSCAYLPLKFALLSTVNPFVKSLLPNNWCIQTLTNVMQLMLIGHGISCIIQRSLNLRDSLATEQQQQQSGQSSAAGATAAAAADQPVCSCCCAHSLQTLQYRSILLRTLSDKFPTAADPDERHLSSKISTSA